MSRRPAVQIVLSFVCVMALAAAPRGQQEVRTGAPPEIRALVDAVLKALDGDAAAWEAMAKERFSADHLNKTTAGDRKELFEKIRKDFGKLTFERATREGPDAPLQLHVKGSTGAIGSISLELDGGSPPRISNIKVAMGDQAGEKGAAGVPPPPIHPQMTPDELARALDGYLSTLAAADVFSGVALVAKGDVPLFHQAYGFADRANRIPNSVRTRFNLGSINKTFTQVAIAQLVEQGRLAHTDTLEKFFPDYPQALSRSATVQQLLSHRAGLADFFGPEFTREPKDRFRSNADYFRFVSARTPLFAPGARNQYCNGCYIALGAIVERVSGVPYEQYVAEHVFKRADMTSTGYPQVDAIEPNVAIGYTRRTDDGQLKSNVYMHGAAGSAAGGGYSTATDLLAFAKAVRKGLFPGSEKGIGIAGGAPGINAIAESNGDWTVVVLTNLDPPTGEQLGLAIMRALEPKRRP
ncbi:MAG TPA: serine hydrolase domain-containing protein [Vicinamibacterales bacterium]|nr:serine hydrolase domain-containing protein [Vicinamibacterales bacterium]